MLALFKNGIQVSKAHDSNACVKIEAYEMGAVVNCRHDDMLADGYEIKETSPIEQSEPTDADLHKYRYAPGGYMNTCHLCDKPFSGDKRAYTCRPCAVELSVCDTPVEKGSK